MTGISHDRNTSCPEYICALLKNSPPDCFYLRFFARLEPRHSRLQIPSLLLWVKLIVGHPCGYPTINMVGVKGFEPPTSCSQTHVLASCSFRYAPSGAFSVLFGALVPTVSMWFSSVCGRRCGQKMSSPEKVPFSACRERIRFAYCSLGFSGCQVNVSTFPDK